MTRLGLTSAANRAGLVVVLAILMRQMPLTGQAPASQPPTRALTLSEAIRYADEHYPTVRAALEQVTAASAGVDAARGAYLPRLDSMWQTTRATANNVFGQVFPQPIVPALTGPVLPSTSAATVWGSAVGMFLSWEPIDFGLRRASVASAQVAVSRARVAEVATRLDVESAVASAFLGEVAAERTSLAAQADFDRREVLAQTVHALVDNQLRPGAEASRADAERAAARTRLIAARETQVLAQTTLGRVLGIGSGQVTIEATTLLDQLPRDEVPAAPPADHPLVQTRRAALDAARADQDVLARTDLPRLYVQSSVFARGSGASPDGVLDTGPGGLGLDRANWGLGIQVSFPNVFDFATLRAHKAAAAAEARSQAALYDEALLRIASERDAAAAMVRAARDIAANTPVQVDAARQSEAQARARYQAGLASIVEVADAQSLLAQAEAQDQVARVDVWRALLAEAVAQGSLAPFERLLGVH